MDIDAFRADWQHLGLVRAGARAAYYRVSPWVSVRVYQLIVLKMATVNQDLRERSTGLEGRMLEPEEVERFSRDAENQMTGSFVREALRKGDECYAFVDDGELASFGWYSTCPTPVERDMTIHFDARYPYMYHGYTKPKYRGRQLHGVGLARACAALTRRGHRGIVSLAEYVNFASLRSSYRVGFRPCGIATRTERGGNVKVWTSAGAAAYDIAMESHGEPLHREVR